MRRHRFEPAKLVAGLVLLCGATLGLLDASDALRQPDWVPLAVVPPGLALAALVAAVGYAARHRARRRAREAHAAAPAPREAGLGAMPMDELRGTYEMRFGGGDVEPPADDDGSGGGAGAYGGRTDGGRTDGERADGGAGAGAGGGGSGGGGR
ncbi:hypothetical protein [Streptomyces synnematoformans]|uniref:TIGR04222 domain-containing membrane protein n=1 Tax=Streptomyces synnematoformans TaxID=415721 RepID=A0ABN1ZJR7_9ACTN